ncbi:MAG TPA: prolipoprotein diacylglyceryl transferase family protein, partial [Deferrisomatales bacterium]|nr:prolipoprotein diacylglyceryl transferase family protein [Deferrisomatales bacterium]
YLLDRRLGEKRPAGLLGFLFVSLYFPARFLVEFTKEYQTLDISTSPLTMGQYLSIPAALLGMWGLGRALKTPVPTKVPEHPEASPRNPGKKNKRSTRRKTRGQESNS